MTADLIFCATEAQEVKVAVEGIYSGSCQNDHEGPYSLPPRVQPHVVSVSSVNLRNTIILFCFCLIFVSEISMFFQILFRSCSRR